MAPKIDWESQIGRRLRFRDLHVLSVVVQQGSMAKAATQLGVSQPSVSEVITDLEHAIGVRLLDRSPKGIEPTIYASALLKRSLVAFDELKQGIRDIEFLADPALGEVRIGCPGAAMASFLPQLIQKFSEAYPKVVLRVSEMPPVAAYSGLRERTLDLHVEWCVPPFSRDDAGNDVNVEYLFDDHLVIVAGLHSRWARRRKIDLVELHAEPWMLGSPNTANYAHIAEAFRARGLAMPKIALETASVPLRIHLLQSGLFIGAMPTSLASQSPVKILPVELPVRPWPFAIFTLKDRTLSPAVDRFIAHLRDFARSNGESGSPRHR
jgi:DNA-binding transcriptional LysR family regulator